MGMDRLFFFSPRAQERLQDYTCMVNKRIEEIWDTYPSLVREGPDMDEVLKKANDAWSGDKLHLNASGYRRVAEARAEIIRKEDIVVREQ
jgi:lysophospholipase L1-like esterase